MTENLYFYELRHALQPYQRLFSFLSHHILVIERQREHLLGGAEAGFPSHYRAKNQVYPLQ